MSTKTSTAALEPLSQRLLLLQRRIPRHPAGGYLEVGKARSKVFARLMGMRGVAVSSRNGASLKETTMNHHSAILMKMPGSAGRRSIRKRLIGAVLLGAFSFVVPVVAAASPAPRKVVKVPIIDRRAMKNLQRWVNDGHDEWCKDAQLVASAEMRRIAPDFAGYQFDLASLPLEKEAQEANRAVFSYTSFDGRVTTYRITLRRYAWLLPLAGDQGSIVWAPARTEILTNN